MVTIRRSLHSRRLPSLRPAWIAGLTSQYHWNLPREWSLSANVDRIHKSLQQLGIEAFTNLRYGTWVIQTIWGRIINNSETKIKSLLLSLVRIECSPVCLWSFNRSPSCCSISIGPPTRWRWYDARLAFTSYQRKTKELHNQSCTQAFCSRSACCSP